MTSWHQRFVETKISWCAGKLQTSLTFPNDVDKKKLCVCPSRDVCFYMYYFRLHSQLAGRDIASLAAPPSRYWLGASRWVLAECLPWPTGCLGLVWGVGWVHYWPFFVVLFLKTHGRLACALVRLCGPWWNHGAALGVASPQLLNLCWRTANDACGGCS